MNASKHGVVSHKAGPAAFTPAKGPAASAAAAAALPPASPHLALAHPQTGREPLQHPGYGRSVMERRFSWVFRYLMAAALNRAYANVI